MSDMGRQSMTDKAGAALKVSYLVWSSCMRVPLDGRLSLLRGLPVSSVAYTRRDLKCLNRY